MRKLFMLSGMVGVMLVGLWAVSAAPAPTNFAGTWALDKPKSQGLPPQMADSIKSYMLTVAQDAQQLTADTKIERSEPAEGGGVGMGGPGGPPGGGPGGPGGGRGGGGMRGGGMMGPPHVAYKLDGSEAALDTGGRGEATVKAEWQDGGKTLKLTTKRTINRDGNDVTMTSTEIWSLAGDGKTLTIKRTSETPRGTQESTLVFNKQ